MNRYLKIAAAAVAAVLVLMQLMPVDRSNPPSSSAMTHPAGEVGEILQAACYDCHTNETVWPWYSYVAPMSFFVADHVVEGREHLNFSTWGQESAADRDHMLDEVIEVVEEGEMPLRSYTLLHGEARLTDAQQTALIEWARAERVRIRSEPGFRPNDGGDDEDEVGGEHARDKV